MAGKALIDELVTRWEELRARGEETSAEELCRDHPELIGSVESVKAVSDIFAPVSGEVTEVNESLATTPEKLNSDPHGAAWLVKVRISAPDEIKQLLSPPDYQSYIQAET